jgi:hypothetical protein
MPRRAGSVSDLLVTGPARADTPRVNDYVPLLQTALWVLLVLVVLRVLGRDFRAALLRRVQEGGSLKVGPVEFGELRNEVATVRSKVDDLGERVSKLFLLTMSAPMYVNLRKLASGAFGPYQMSGGLERELYHLRDLGYVEVHAIREIPASGSELLDHVSITEAGSQFVALREEMAPQV